MEADNKEQTTDSEEQIEVDLFRPADAKGIVELFRAVYGEGYPIKVFYDEKGLTDANVQGEYLLNSSPRGVRQGGWSATLVSVGPVQIAIRSRRGSGFEGYRQFGVNKRMLDFVFNKWVPKQGTIEHTFGEAVCNHPYMQRVVSQMGHVETALEIALMPAEAYDKERSASGRVAALLVFRCYKPKPHGVFLPPAYREGVAMDLFAA